MNKMQNCYYSEFEQVVGMINLTPMYLLVCGISIFIFGILSAEAVKRFLITTALGMLRRVHKSLRYVLRLVENTERRLRKQNMRIPKAYGSKGGRRAYAKRHVRIRPEKTLAGRPDSESDDEHTKLNGVSKQPVIINDQNCSGRGIMNPPHRKARKSKKVSFDAVHPAVGTKAGVGFLQTNEHVRGALSTRVEKRSEKKFPASKKRKNFGVDVGPKSQKLDRILRAVTTAVRATTHSVATTAAKAVLLSEEICRNTILNQENAVKKAKSILFRDYCLPSQVGGYRIRDTSDVLTKWGDNSLSIDEVRIVDLTLYHQLLPIYLEAREVLGNSLAIRRYNDRVRFDSDYENPNSVEETEFLISIDYDRLDTLLNLLFTIVC